MKHYYFVYYDSTAAVKCVINITRLEVMTATEVLEQLRRYLHAQVKP